MEFTFGIITSYGTSEFLLKIIDQIKTEVPKYKREIIVVGGNNPNIEGVIHIEFDDSQKPMWITRKKNLITHNSTKENIVYLHDYIGFTPGWYEGQLKKGNNFDIRMDKIINYDGTRFRDWSIWPHNGNEMDSIIGRECLIPYNIDQLVKYMYISGTYWIAKRRVMLEFPLNENLLWGQGEDVEWSKQVREKCNFQMNENSSVNILKPGKDRAFEYATEDTVNRALQFINVNNSQKNNKRKFIIISTVHNKGKFVGYNVNSLKQQSYSNFIAAYGYDKSTDDSLEHLKSSIGNDNRFIIHNNENPGCYLNCYMSTYKFLKENDLINPEDIIVEIDGDDWLLHSFVLQYINDVYESNPHIWMTYGQYITFPSGEYGGHFHLSLNDQVDFHNQYRNAEFPYSHLKTYKAFLLDNIVDEDLIDPQTGKYFNAAADFALCMPLVEQAGKNRIFRVDQPMYVYNTSTDVESETNNRLHLQKEVEMRIRKKSPKTRLANKPYSNYNIVNGLAGGLGNMMFQIAAGYATAKEVNGKFFLYPNEIGGMMHKHPTEYLDTVFRNIKILDISESFKEIEHNSFHYEPVNIDDQDYKNLFLIGGFQSFKYFEKYSKDIRSLFSPTSDLVVDLKVKYDTNNKVSIHIRRGDYTNLPNHHHNLSMSYYLNAINYFKGFKFLVFSDDIDWCKDNFIGDNFIFVEDTNDIEDLYLMSMCEHNIIANSTFSWWGAWLNSNSNKKVVYPNTWFGPVYKHFRTNDLFPEDWICLDEDFPKLQLNLFDNAFRHLSNENGRYSSVHNKISNKIEFVRDLYKYDGITIFTDDYLNNNVAKQVDSEKKIGWLLEPRQIQPLRYNEFEKYKDDFDYVITHDEELLKKYPEKTRFGIVGGTWIKTKNYGLHHKNKNISIIYSNKTDLEGHRLRHEVARHINGLDLYGRGTSNPIDNKEESLLEYRYSIVIENSRAKGYFTEKLIDCLITGTIPIYWGCTNIQDFFDIRGIYIVNNLQDIKNIIDNLGENDYFNKIEYIKNNFEFAKKYAVTEDWMYENIFKTK